MISQDVDSTCGALASGIEISSRGRTGAAASVGTGVGAGVGQVTAESSEF